MKARKVFMSAASLMLALSFMAGCGQKPNEDNKSKETKAQETKAGEQKETEKAKEGEGKKAAFFPLEKPVSITIAGVRGDANPPFSDVTYFKELEKQTNVKVEWLDWPQSIQKEKRSLAFSSGDLPDAFYGSWSLDKPDVVKYGGDGLLLDLNPYINEDVMPNVTQLFKDVKGLKTSLQVPTGEVYVLATLNQNGLPKTNDTMVINSDWLKKVNKQIPTTTEELKDVLRAFKAAGDLNGNGQDDEIPMSFIYGDGNSGFFGLMGFTGIPAQNKNSRMVMKDGKPAFFPALDEYKEYLTFLHEIQAEGLLDPEVFTMNNPAYNAKTQTPTPTVGFLSTWSAETVNKSIKGNDPKKEGTYVYVKPLKGPKGVEPKWGLRVNPLNANLSFAVSAKTEHAELIARWIDLAYDKQTSINNYVGLVGKYIKHEGGNKYSNILKPNGKRYSKDDMSVDIPAKFAVAWVREGDVEFTDKIVSPQNKNAADELYGPYLEHNYVNDYIMSSIEENNRMALLATDLFAYVDQMTAKFVTDGGIEEGWDKYIKQLKSLGVDEYTQIKTDINNRANGNK